MFVSMHSHYACQCHSPQHRSSATWEPDAINKEHLVHNGHPFTFTTSQVVAAHPSGGHWASDKCNSTTWMVDHDKDASLAVPLLNYHLAGFSDVSHLLDLTCQVVCASEAEGRQAMGLGCRDLSVVVGQQDDGQRSNSSCAACRSFLLGSQHLLLATQTQQAWM